MSERTLHRVVGAAVFAALAVAVVALLVVDCRRALRPGITVQVELAESGPLRAGAPVRIAGVVIGRVDGLTFVPGDRDGPRVVLSVWLDRRHAHLVRDNARFFVTRRAMLAEPYVEVALPPGAAPGAPLRAGARVRGDGPVDVDQLLQKGHDTLDAVIALMREVPEAGELAEAIAALEATAARIGAAAGGADPLGAGVRAYGQVAALAHEAQVSPAQVAATARRARAVAARGAQSAAALRPAAAGLAERGEAVAAAVGRLELGALEVALARVGPITARVERLAGEVEAAVALVERGHGTIGALLADDELGDQVQELARMLKQRPWRLIGGRLGAD